MKKLLLMTGMLLSANYSLAIRDIKFEITNSFDYPAIVQIQAKDKNILNATRIPSGETETLQLTDTQADAHHKTTGTLIVTTTNPISNKTNKSTLSVPLIKKWFDSHKVTIDTEGKAKLETE